MCGGTELYYYKVFNLKAAVNYCIRQTNPSEVRQYRRSCNLWRKVAIIVNKILSSDFDEGKFELKIYMTYNSVREIYTYINTINFKLVGEI